MSLLCSIAPKRLFTFGCSFTLFPYDTWADLVAYDLNVDMYNFGRSGAGNQFIFNTLIQAINHYQINENDLVMICWTNVCREDRRLKEGWLTPGNIYTQSVYPEYFVKQFVWPEGMLIRDFAPMDAARRLLMSITPNVQFMAMADFSVTNEWAAPDEKLYSLKVFELYKETQQYIKPSFFRVLWDNNISKRLEDTSNATGIAEAHPWTIDHLTYLQRIFSDHVFRDETINYAQQQTQKYIDLCSKHKVNYYETPNWQAELEQTKQVINYADYLL